MKTKRYHLPQTFFLMCVSLFIFSSCGKDTGMRITTNTFANKEIIPHGFEKNASFYISTNQRGEKLFTQEVSQKIATLLSNKGFEISPNENADYHLTFSFGMKKSTHVRDVPVFIPDYGHWHYHHYHHHYSYGYSVAYVPEEYTLFNKILLVEVYKKGGFLAGDKKTPVWQGTAHSYEEDSDLRDAIDYLLVTVFKHFGGDTPRYIVSKMEEGDARVKELRKKYFRPVGHEE